VEAAYALINPTDFLEYLTFYKLVMDAKFFGSYGF
jgi:hypothetical protein